MNFTLRITEITNVTQRVQTHSLRRFLRRLRTINWQKSNLRAYLKVSYGKQPDNFGRMITFYNDGLYNNQKDFWLAFNAFIEDQGTQLKR